MKTLHLLHRGQANCAYCGVKLRVHRHKTIPEWTHDPRDIAHPPAGYAACEPTPVFKDSP